MIDGPSAIQLQMMGEKIAALIRLADDRQDHLLAASLCDARAYIDRKLEAPGD